MKLVMYFADAFGWQYTQDAPFMEDFWSQRRPLQTILGYSSTIIPCLISGSMPRDTGVWTEYYREDRPQSKLAKAIVSSRVLLTPTNLARLVVFRVARLRGMPAAHRLRLPLQFAHLFARHDMDYRQFPPVALPVPTMKDVASDLGLRFSFRYLGHQFDQQEEIQRMKEQMSEVDVFFFYDASIDLYGHHRGASVKALSSEISRVASFLTEATGIVEQSDTAEVLLFSDHGMTDVASTYDLLAALQGLTIGTDYLAFIDSTFTRFWYLKPGAKEAVHAKLTGAPASFLSREEQARYGIDFPDTRYGEDILAADEGVVFHPSYISPSFFRTKEYPEKGTHGYRPEAPTASGICFYRGTVIDQELSDPVPASQVFDYASVIMKAVAGSAQ